MAVSVVVLLGALACDGTPGTGRADMDAGGTGITLRDGAAVDAVPGTDGGAGAFDAEAPGPDAGPLSSIDPPLGGSSGGTGGAVARGERRTAPSGVRYRIIVPPSYREGTPTAFMIVFSGTEGEVTMTNNLLSLASMVGLGDLIFAVIDGPTYFGNGAAGEAVLDHVRSEHDVDNDRTYLLSESAGTRAGLELGLRLRQSWFAAYWANDVNASQTPLQDAGELGFAPWGNAGPGGAFAQADAIVAGMRTAGYRIADPAPYDGPGAGTHGAPQQFIAALRWFPGKSRR